MNYKGIIINKSTKLKNYVEKVEAVLSTKQ